MRIDEPIEASGFFWLPDEPDFRVPGSLHISDSGEVKLDVQLPGISGGWKEVVESFFSSESPDAKRILGMTDGKGAVTVDDCRVANVRRFGAPPTELNLRARVAFSGCHYQAGEEVTFTQFDFSVEGIDEWLGISGIGVQFDWENPEVFSMDIRVPDPIVVDLPDGAKLKFTFSMAFPTVTRTITEARVTQRACVSIESLQPRPLDYFTSLATKLRNFLRLAMGQPVSIDSATCFTPELTRPDGAGGEHKVPIKAYYRDGGSSDKRQETLWLHMVFLYRDVKDEIESVLANWIRSYELFAPALDVYFTTMANTSQYLEVEFLQRIQGIETLHRRISSDKEMPEEEFRELVDALVRTCPAERREWLKTSLRYANEIRLRQRLRDMMEPFANLFPDTKQQKAFIDRVVVTRNYLTHYDPLLERRAARGQPLWELTEGLTALFQLHLLKLIGFSPDRVNRVLQGTSNIQRLLTSAGMHTQEAPALENNAQ